MLRLCRRLALSLSGRGSLSGLGYSAELVLELLPQAVRNGGNTVCLSA